MKTNKKWLVVTGVAAGSIVLESCLMPLRGYDFRVSGIVALIIFAIYTYCCLTFIRNIKSGIILISILAGLLAIHLPIRISYWEETLVSFPDMIMHFVGVAFGFAFRVSGKRIRLLVVAPLLVLTAVGYVYGLGYFQNKLSFDTWTGKVEQAVLLSPMVFDTPDGGRKSLNDFKGNYLVLDFWSTTCGVCYKAFPDVQKLYDKYKDNSGVEILAVHCRYDRDDDTIDTGSKILLERGYTFPCLSMNVEDPVLIEVGVQVFPTLLIFDPDGKLVFRGNIGDAGKYMDEYLK